MLRTSCESGGRAERVPGVTKFSSICRLHCAVGLKTDAPRCYPEHLSATNQNDGVNAAGPCARDLNDARERMREVPSGRMLTMVETRRTDAMVRGRSGQTLAMAEGGGGEGPHRADTCGG